MAAPSRSRPRPGAAKYDRSGRSTGAYIVGLAELQKELRALGATDMKKWNLEIGRSFRPIAKRAQGDARAAARAFGGPQKHFANAISGRATAREVRLQITNPDAYGAFWGAKQDHTGWNAGHRGKPNQPRWVGNQYENAWSVGVKGEGPYAINDSIADNLESYVDELWTAVDRVVADAFPDGRL